MEEGKQTLTRIIGIYDADGTWTGEIAYALGKWFGNRHCSLCDITHAGVSEKEESKECRLRLKVPFDLLHRNDALPVPGYKGPFPVVLGIVGQNSSCVVLLDGKALDECDKSPTKMIEKIEAKIAQEKLL